MTATTWSLRYMGFDPSKERLRETLCTVGNGYFATRGASPESTADSVHYPGTYVAGCYNRVKSKLDGSVTENESMVNVPNWLALSFKIANGDWFDLQNVEILHHEQYIDVKDGIFVRKVRFKDSEGRISRLDQTRFANMQYPHLAALQTKLTAENWSGGVTFLSALDGRVTNSGVQNYRFFSGNHLKPDAQSVSEDGVMLLSVRTNQSGIKIAQACNTKILSGGKEPRVRQKDTIKPAYIGQEFQVNLGKGKSVTVEKLIALYTSKDPAISEPGYAATRGVRNAPGFLEQKIHHAQAWNDLWRWFRISLTGDDRAALALHVHIFHLLQTISLNSTDIDAGIPARGLHGEGYRGHVFWDELLVFPFLNIHLPDLTRSLLLYRYRRLSESRLIALNYGLKGALFAWESGSDGREETPTLQLNPISKRWVKINTHLEYHVNAAVAYNIWSYFQVTHDLDFMALYGLEMLIDISQFFASITHLNGSTGRYEIQKVMGPDEYHASYPGSKELGVDNNAYTNVMVVWVLQRTLEAIRQMRQSMRRTFLERSQVSEEELSHWEEITRKMFVPFQNNGGIISQFEGYEKLKEFDWDGYRKKYTSLQRVDDILESEGDSVNNYKITKQADLLMLFYLFSFDELHEIFARLGYPFEEETLKKNVEYYLNRTTNASSLSRVVHSWLLARLNREESWHIAKEALRSDISDIQGGTTAEGVHLGAMAGTVGIIERAYTGLVTRANVLWLDPTLPKEIKKASFTFFYRGQILELNLTSKLLEIRSSPGLAAPVKIGFKGKTFEISPGGVLKFDILRRSAHKALRQNAARQMVPLPNLIA